MAWTSPRTWTTSELVTAAMMNTHVRDNLLFLSGTASTVVNDSASGFTNTSYADLDALTTDPFAAPAIVTVATMTTAIVIVSVRSCIQNTSGDLFMGYRVSGATTVASDDTRALRASAAASQSSRTFVNFHSGLTAGNNTFEMQARVTANNANASNPSLTIIPLTT